MSFVIADGASNESGGVVDVALDIGSGTSRTAYYPFAFEDTDNNRTASAVYDPAGTSVAMEQIGTTQSLSDDGTPEKLAWFQYDIPDGQSGSKTFRATASGGGAPRVNGAVAVFDTVNPGAPEAGPVWSTVPAPTGGTATTGQITTLSDGATIVQIVMIHGGADGDETFTAPTGGSPQTEHIEEAFQTRLHVHIGSYVKAAFGAQTIGSTADAAFTLAIQGLIAFAVPAGPLPGPTILAPIGAEVIDGSYLVEWEEA